MLHDMCGARRCEAHNCAPGMTARSPSLRRREAAAVATAVVCVGLATYFVGGNAVSLPLMAAAATYAYSLLGLGGISRERAVGLIGGAAAVGLGRILVAAVRPILDPSTKGTWDFLCFYLYGSICTDPWGSVA